MSSSIDHDGPLSVQWGCDLFTLQEMDDGECVIYSFVTSQFERDIAFETAAVNLLPHCQLHLFLSGEYDEELDTTNMTVHEWRTVDGQSDDEKESLSSIMARMGHSHLDVLNVDLMELQLTSFFAPTDYDQYPPSIGQMNLRMKESLELSDLSFLEDRSLRLYQATTDQQGTSLA